MEQKIKDLIGSVPAEHIGKPLLKAKLSEKQWQNVNFINQALRQEYSCRRDMILKRLDVTIQSFKWSDRVKVASYAQCSSKVSIRSELPGGVTR